MISITCGDCRHEFEAPVMRAGMDTLCPQCATRVRVPRPGENEVTVAAHGAGGHHGAGAASRQADTLGGQRPVGLRTSRGPGGRRTLEDPARPPHPPAPGAHRRPPAAHQEEHSSFRTLSSTERWSRESDRIRTPHREEPVRRSDESGIRNLEPHIEDETRRANLHRIGLVLLIAFLLPVVGAEGIARTFAQFFWFPGLNPAGFLVALPLFAGIAVILQSKQSDPPARSLVMVLLGCAMFLTLMLDPRSRSMASESLVSGSVDIRASEVLAVIAVLALFTSIRVRWYRPADGPSYAIGALAGGMYVLSLFIPSNNSIPIAEVLRTFEIHALLGFGVLAHVCLMLATATLCLINIPTTVPAESCDKASLAFKCLVGAVAIPVVLFLASALNLFGPAPAIRGTDTGSPAILVISSAIKYGTLYGGLTLLIPIGIADLMIGRPRIRPV